MATRYGVGWFMWSYTIFWQILNFTQQWVCRLWTFCARRYVVYHTRYVSGEYYASILRENTCCLRTQDNHPEYESVGSPETSVPIYYRTCHIMSYYNHQVWRRSLVQEVTILPCIWVAPDMHLSQCTQNTKRWFVVFLSSSKFHNNKFHRTTTVYSHTLVTVSFILSYQMTLNSLTNKIYEFIVKQLYYVKYT
jgi:hypothetical protein